MGVPPSKASDLRSAIGLSDAVWALATVAFRPCPRVPKKGEVGIAVDPGNLKPNTGRCNDNTDFEIRFVSGLATRRGL